MAKQTKTTRVLRNLKKQSFEPKTPIASEMFLPNLSGDHSKGNVRTTPTQDLNIPNKKYVDDLHAAIDHTSILNIGTNAHTAIDTHIALVNEHINWTNTTANFITSGNANAGIITATTYIATTGASAGLLFQERDGAPNWMWYGNAGVAYLYDGAGALVYIYQTTGNTTIAGDLNAVGGFKDNGSAGIDATFTNGDGDTVTVKGGIITSIV